MTNFDFMLLIAGIEEINEDIENAIFEAGCDDCTISQRYGRTYLTFSRSAESFKDAVISAICNVRDSKIKASVFRVYLSDLFNQPEDRDEERVDLELSVINSVLEIKRQREIAPELTEQIMQALGKD